LDTVLAGSITGSSTEDTHAHCSCSRIIEVSLVCMCVLSWHHITSCGGRYDLDFVQAQLKSLFFALLEFWVFEFKAGSHKLCDCSVLFGAGSQLCLEQASSIQSSGFGKILRLTTVTL